MAKKSVHFNSVDKTRLTAFFILMVSSSAHFNRVGIPIDFRVGSRCLVSVSIIRKNRKANKLFEGCLIYEVCKPDSVELFSFFLKPLVSSDQEVRFISPEYCVPGDPRKIYLPLEVVETSQVPMKLLSALVKKCSVVSRRDSECLPYLLRGSFSRTLRQSKVHVLYLGMFGVYMSAKVSYIGGITPSACLLKASKVSNSVTIS